ncbi:hypothetical protein DFH27DRAFT_526122 [Peziza echinospora]|nr:hypothetical protein DFH27DRAFT_526122 [Peziza echinospora]
MATIGEKRHSSLDLDLPGSFSSPYEINLEAQSTPRQPPPKPHNPSHMRLIGLRSPGEEDLPLSEVLRKFALKSKDDHPSQTHQQGQVMPIVHPPTQVTFNARQDMPLPQEKRLKRARSRTLEDTGSNNLARGESAPPQPSDPRAIPEALKQARLDELASQTRRIEAEMAAVRNHTWIPSESPQPQRQEHRDANLPRAYHLRFDPSALPKYTQPDDLESWLSEMQLEVNTFGETVVCPAIYRHCFKSGDPVKSWYTMLGPDKAEDLTKGPSCWFRFASAMREVWSKSIAATQREAEDRSKLHSESFIQYYFEKLKLLQAAFPESAHSTHISRIRARFNDAQADRFIREQTDLIVFSDQCRQYDDHLKLHPVSQRINQFTYPSGGTARYRQQLQPAITTRAATAPPSSTLATPVPLVLTRDSSSAAPPSRVKDTSRQSRPDVRLTTVADRLNPATGKN